MVDLENQPPVLAVFAFPVIDAQAGDGAQAGVDPDFLSGGGIERNDRVVPAVDVHDAVDNDRIHRRASVEVRPGHLELLDVALLDLVESRKPGRVRAPAEILPGFVILLRGGE